MGAFRFIHIIGDGWSGKFQKGPIQSGGGAGSGSCSAKTNTRSRMPRPRLVAPLSHSAITGPDLYRPFTIHTPLIPPSLRLNAPRSLYTPFGRTPRRFSSAAFSARKLYTPLQLPRGARRLQTTAKMALADEQHEWAAKRVRETFINFFKEKGHTFGKCQ